MSIPATTPPRAHPPEEVVRRELAREAATMVLYVSLTLLTALVAIPSDDVPGTLETAALLWGGAAGLALAHWLAFDLGARLATCVLAFILACGGSPSGAAPARASRAPSSEARSSLVAAGLIVVVKIAIDH